MKCATLVMFLLTTASALAEAQERSLEDTPQQEPAALVQARKAYESEVKAAVDPIKASGLEQAWSLEGGWTGVVGDEGQGAIFTINRNGKCVEVDLAGKKQREIKLSKGVRPILRLVALGGDGAKALLTFSVWGEGLRVYDLSGKQLWSYPQATGVDDVWTGDLHGDGSDEVIVGYNGMTGLHVLDSHGQLLWKSAAIGNVWHVCAGDVLGQGKSQVVTTSAAGKVHVFGSDGKKSNDLDAGCYASMVRIGKLSEKDKAATILIAGSDLSGGADPKLEILTAAFRRRRQAMVPGIACRNPAER